MQETRNPDAVDLGSRILVRGSVEWVGSLQPYQGRYRYGCHCLLESSDRQVWSWTGVEEKAVDAFTATGSDVGVKHSGVTIITQTDEIEMRLIHWFSKVSLASLPSRFDSAFSVDYFWQSKVGRRPGREHFARTAIFPR